MLHTKSRGNRSSGSGEEDLSRGIWAMQSSWSCDQHLRKKFSFPCTLKLTHKI